MQLGSALTTLYWFSFLEVSSQDALVGTTSILIVRPTHCQLCVVIVAYTIKAVNEEKMLLIHFGDKYRRCVV